MDGREAKREILAKIFEVRVLLQESPHGRVRDMIGSLLDMMQQYLMKR